MSSSFVADDTPEQKSDSQVVIVFDENGTVCLDEQTLQKLLANKNLQQPLSVVRMNQDGKEVSLPITETVVSADGQPEVNLTVEGFFPSTVSTDATPSSADPLNAFMHMDQDQLEKLENALQSEQAKQILGESMIDMLKSKDEKTDGSKKTTSIQLDHCYTGSSKAGNGADSNDEETDSEGEEIAKTRSTRGRARRARGGKTVPGAARGRGGANTAATRKATRAQLAPPAPPPESKPPANLTKLGQSPAKTMLRTAKNTPVKKEEKPVAERKTYPQRTNRKPPAHLADAFGPGFNSSPDLSKKEVAKKELVAEIKEEDDSGYALDIIPNNTAQALLVPEVIQELQAVLGDLGPEVLKPLEEAKAEMDEALLEEEEEEKVKEQQAKAIAARRRSSSIKGEESPSKGGRPPRKSSLSTVTSDAIKDLQTGSDEEEEEEDSEEGDEEWDSEDDPDKLWCICRKPHNNRFMICCDKCEDWFHGQCVGINKSMGKQMEKEGKEWTCPKCKKLMSDGETAVKSNEVVIAKTGLESSPAKARRSSSTSSTSLSSKKSPKPVQPDKASEKPVGPKLSQKRPEAKKLTPLVINESPKPAPLPTPVKKVSCIVCKKPARPSSIYCTDECIVVHAQDSLNLLKKSQVLTPITPKSEGPPKSEATVPPQTSSAENRVLMYEQKTGRILAGSSAPTEANLKSWLKENPTYQVCKPNLVANIKQKLQDKTQIYIKTNTAPKSEPKAVSILGLPLKSPKTPGKGVQLIPSQRMPQTGKSPASPTKTAKSEAKAPTSTTPVAGTKPSTVKIVTKSSPLKQIAPKPAPKEPTTVKSSSEAVPKRQSSSEATRLSVRNSLQDVFKTRMDECKDVKVSENELKGIATSIEEELFALFKDVGSKYKAKFRSIHFNVKDPKNLALFRKIVSGEYSPHQLVRLSSEDLASKELAEWREQEEKHSIEMIKKTEMDLIHQNVTYIKTHKGEQIIETDDSLKLQGIPADAVEAETAVEPTPDSSTVEDVEVPIMRPPSSSSSHSKSKSKDHNSSHRHHHKSSKSRHHDSKRHSSSHKSSHSSSSHSKDSKEKSKGDSKSESNRKHSRHSSSSSDHKNKDQEEKLSRSSSSLSKTSDHKSSKEKPLAVAESGLSEKEREIMEKLEKTVKASSTPVFTAEEETLSDREPSSTVNIKTPESISEENITSIWKGVVSTVDATNFHVSISEVSGSAPNFGSDFPKVCDIVGRISSDTVWDYISKTKKVGSKEILVVRLSPTSPEDKQSYMSYYNYLLSRKRFGVVGKKGSTIKDFYIMPLPCKSPVPQILLPFDGPGFEENRPNLLLGIVVQMQRKRSASSAVGSGPSKVSKSSKVEVRSYTPPLPEAKYSETPSRSYTPPLASNAVEPYSPTQPKIKKVPVVMEDDEPYSPSAGLNSPDECETLESLNRKIEEEKIKIETISSELVCTNSKGPYGEPVKVASFLTTISSDIVKKKPITIPGLSEIIVQSTGATLNASVALEKQDDENEAYSPSRSFTPPPQPSSIPFLPDTSTISLPSNLQEILASIQKRPSAMLESSSMGLSLDCDPIVRDYADEDLEEPSTPPLDSTTKAIMDQEENEDDANSFMPRSSGSVAPPEKRRDPRQKKPEKQQSSLSKLSDAELLAKAQEMLSEQEPVLPVPPQVMSYTPTSFPPLPVNTRIPPPVLPPMPPAFNIPPPPPGTDFKDQDMRRYDPDRKGISFKVTKRPNLPRWDRKRQEDWDTDGSGASFSKRSRNSPPSRSRSRDSD